MKKIFALLAILISFGCSKDSFDQKQQNEKAGDIHFFYVAANESELTEFVPSVMVSCDREALIRYYNPVDKEVELYQYLGGDGDVVNILFAKDAVYFIGQDYLDNPIAVLSVKDGYDVLYSGHFDSDGRFVCVSQERFLTKTTTKASYETEIKNSFKDFYENIYKQGPEAVSACNIALSDKFLAGNIITVILRFAGTVGLNIMSETEEEADNYTNRLYKDTLNDLIWGVITYKLNSIRTSEIVKFFGQGIIRTFLNMWDVVDWAKIDWDSVEEYLFELPDDYTEESVCESYLLYAKKVNQDFDAYKPINFEAEQNPYSLTVSVSSITEESALVKGSITYTGTASSGWAVVEQGFRYRSKPTEEWEYVPSTDYAQKALSLYPGTHYSVQAYVKTLSGTLVTSSCFDFITRGFSIYINPDSFTVGKGESHRASIVYGGDGVDWKVKRKPSWCSVETSATTVWIDIHSTNKNREGIVEIEFTNSYKERTTASIKINQMSSSWDYTSWHYVLETFSGDMSFKNISEGYYVYVVIEKCTRFSFKSIPEEYASKITKVC